MMSTSPTMLPRTTPAKYPTLGGAGTIQRLWRPSIRAMVATSSRLVKVSGPMASMPPNTARFTLWCGYPWPKIHPTGKLRPADWSYRDSRWLNPRKKSMIIVLMAMACDNSMAGAVACME